MHLSGGYLVGLEQPNSVPTDVLSPTAGVKTQLQKYEGRLAGYVHSQLQEVLFGFYRVEGGFGVRSAFSKVDLSLAAYCVGSYRPGIRASDLFKVEVKPEYLEPLKFILNSRSHPWPTFVHNHKRTEEDVMVSIAINILVKLCTEVTMEKRYSTPLREPLLSFSDLGLGSPETWHGTPDARVRGTQVVHRMKSDIEDAAGEDSSDNESASSDGRCIG